MDILNILRYGGITVLLTLLIVFELKEGRFGNQRLPSGGYEYYTINNKPVRIYKAFGSLYKVYDSHCPFPTKTDRFGNYFTVKARSAPEAEYLIDDIYQRGGVDVS